MAKKIIKSKETDTFVKYDLACGDNKAPGFLGVDKYKTSSTDLVMDLTEKWKIKDNSVDEIHCSHYIEHVVDLCHFWSELYRVLKVGGKATIIAPYAKSNRAWQDPTHVRCIVEESFLYLMKNFRELNKLSHYLPKDVDFDVVVTYHGLSQEWMLKSEDTRNFAIKHYWNVVSDIQGVLTKK
jgi:hypothetical protein